MSSSGSKPWTDRLVRDLLQQERDEDRLLGQLAVGRGLLSPEDLEACFREVHESCANGKKIPLGEILVQRRVLTTETLIELLRDPRRGAEDVPNIPRYELRGRLGEGTSAVVYRAWDRELQRPVALKVLRDSAALSDVARERFRREARAAGGLSHPNVVHVHDVGEVEGRLYIVLELVEGRPLSFSMREGAPRETLLRALVQSARGVAAAHAKGIVHRDLKPANILLAPSGEPKVGDFGLAHLAGSTLELTRTGSTLGTPLYMAPEQVQGSVHKISPRTDVYALGAILYEVLTGRPPHAGETVAETYDKVLHQQPVPPRRTVASVSRDLETVTLKALDKDSDRRYPTAAEFAEDLQHAMDGEPIIARPEGQARRLWRRAIHSRRVLLPIAAAILVGLGLGTVFSRTGKRVAATLESVRGEVAIVGSAGRSFVQVGSPLAPGESLETGPAPSRALLRLSGGASLEAGPETVLRAAADGSFIVPSGTLSAESAGGILLLSTPQAEIRTDGGACNVAVDAGWARVESKAGRVRVTRLRDGRSVDLPAGASVRVTPEGGALDPVPLVDRVLRVGPGKPFAVPSGAALAATDGAVVEIDAGVYEGDVAIWKAAHLTIRGVGGRVQIKSSGKFANGRAVWILAGRNTLIENIEFSECTGSNATVGCLMLDAPGLTLRKCSFLDNSRALTGRDDPESDLVIEHSEFARNGNNSGTSNLACPLQRSLVLRHCYIHQGREGHQISSNARSTYVLYCRVADEGVRSSMALDLKFGGPAYVIGNVFFRGATAAINDCAINYSMYETPLPESTLYFVNNTVVAEKRVQMFIGVGPGANSRIVNNIFVGKVPILRGKGDLANNLVGQDPLFVDPDALDFRLRKGSPAIDAGVDPGTAGNFDLHPRFQYVHPASLEIRPSRGAIDLGAFEFVR